MRSARIRRVRLVVSDEAIRDTELLKAEFPTIDVSIERGARLHAPFDAARRDSDVHVDAGAWHHATEFHSFDALFERSTSETVAIVAPTPHRHARRDEAPGAHVVGAACEVLTRWQRLIDRRNAGSSSAVFEAVLREHARRHDLEKPLVRADHEHALDAWQWTLRLAPEASLAVQLAALLHDIERLESEAERRIEHHARDYAAFKGSHAARGAILAAELLDDAGIDAATTGRVCALVAAHEERGADGELALLNDADALSFFSLNSSGYADYFGPDQTRRKVAYSLARLGPAARARLAVVKLRPDVRSFVEEALAA